MEGPSGSHQGHKLGNEAHIHLCLPSHGSPSPFPVGCFSPGVSILTLPVSVLHFPCFRYGNSWLYFKIIGLKGHFLLLIPFKMNWFVFICPFTRFFTYPYVSPFACGQTAKKWRDSQSSLFMDSAFVNLPTRQDLFVTPKSVFVALSWSFMDRSRAVKNWTSLPFPDEAEQGDHPPSCFSSPSVESIL